MLEATTTAVPIMTTTTTTAAVVAAALAAAAATVLFQQSHPTTINKYQLNIVGRDIHLRASIGFLVARRGDRIQSQRV